MRFFVLQQVARSGVYALLVIYLGIGCRSESTPREAQHAARPTIETNTTTENWEPLILRVASYAGADDCKPCHTEIYSQWDKSSHGRAMALPSAETVLARFDGQPVSIHGGQVTPVQKDDKFFMVIDTASGRETHSVDLVLASGRQHQDYFEQYGKNRYRLLPILWGRNRATWIPVEAYRASSLDSSSRRHWQKNDLGTMGCIDCHLSQGHYVGQEVRWVDLSVNCESCHGSGRDHVQRMRTGATDQGYRDLEALSKEQEARLCGQCHGFQEELRFAPDPADDLPRFLAATLAFPGFRADGTQVATNYQLAGHLISDCHAKGSMKCSHCHDPHSGHARSLAGEPAWGEHSDRQCTVCHRNYLDDTTAAAHSHHSKSVQCVSCHMSPSWMFDRPDLDQQTADHSIQIPHPRESKELSTTNACTTCHAGKSADWALQALGEWGARRATEVRPWVRAIALGKAHAREASGLILEVLEQQDYPSPYVRLSLIDVLADQPANPKTHQILAKHAAAEDPHLRALTLRALAIHDTKNRDEWLRNAMQDKHFFVRWQALVATSVLERRGVIQKGPPRFSVDLEQQLQNERQSYSHGSVTGAASSE